PLLDTAGRRSLINELDRSQAVPKLRRHGAEIAGEPAAVAVSHEIEAVAGRAAALGHGAYELLEPAAPVLLGEASQLGVDGLVELPRQEDRRVPIDIEDRNDCGGAEQRKIGQRQAKGGGPEELSERCHGWCSRRLGPCAGGDCRSSCRFWT